MGKKQTARKPVAATAFAETEFTPEQNALQLTPEQEQHERQQRLLKMHAATVDRELQRIAVENGIRLGDSLIAEVNAVEFVSGALKDLKEYYLTLIEE